MKRTHEKNFQKNFRLLRKTMSAFFGEEMATQKAIADELGISRKTVIFWEEGSNVPSEMNLRKIAMYFSKKLHIRPSLEVEDLLEKDLEEILFVVPQRAEIKRVSPTQMKLLREIFARSGSLSEKDLEKLLEWTKKFAGKGPGKRQSDEMSRKKQV